MKSENINNQYKIGIYVRESRDDFEENYETIETQRELLIDFIKKNGLGEIKKIYEDDNVSGSSFERAGIQQLKEDVSRRIVDLIVLKDLSRLGRNNAKTLLFLDYLEEHGVRIITFDGRYDSSRDNDTVGIDTWYNERYVRDISRKIRSTLRFKIQRGEYIGNAPFGYQKSLEKKNSLVIDIEAAETVKKIFKLYSEGYGYAYIARIINNEGLSSPFVKKGRGNGGELWNPTSIRRIINNRVYSGDTVQGVSEKVSFKSKKTRRLPKEKWVVTTDTHEPIISRAEFEEAQRIIKGRSKTCGPHKGTIHVFRGLIFCGKCGSSMFARTRKNKSMGYICGNYCKNGKSVCTSHYIDEKTLKKIILDEIRSLLNDDALKEQVMLKLKSETDREKDYNAEIEKMEQLILSKQRQQDVIYMDKLEGKISEQMFYRINGNIEARIASIQNEITKMRLRADKKADEYEKYREISMNLNEDSITYEVVNIVVKTITIYDPGDVWHFYPGNEELYSNITQKGAVVVKFTF